MTLLTIGEFARASGLTPKALRLYDELGLLVPADVDPHNGYRRYAPDQLGPARLVATLRLIGMPLARIATVLDRPTDAASGIASYWRQVEADTAARREIVRDLVSQLDHEESPMPTTPNPNPSPTESPTTKVGVSHRQGGRDLQQDAVLTTGDTFAVADGFGDRDDVAQAALDHFAAEGFAGAAAAVASLAAAPSDAEHGNGTTLTAVRLAGDTAQVTHLGDARVHLVREGAIRTLTTDHTLVATLIQSGELTEDEARSHPHRMLLNRALAHDPEVLPDEVTVPVQAGDRLVLTTDGVHATLSPETLRELLTRYEAPESVATAIGDAVDDAGAPDNHSVVIIDLGTA